MQNNCWVPSNQSDDDTNKIHSHAYPCSWSDYTVMFFSLVVLGNQESAPIINAPKIRMMKVGWMIGNKREEDRKWIQVAIRGGID